MEFVTNILDAFRALIVNQWAPAIAFICFGLALITWAFGGHHNSKFAIVTVLLVCGALITLGRVWAWFTSAAGAGGSLV